jgi:hypothetical protein
MGAFHQGEPQVKRRRLRFDQLVPAQQASENRLSWAVKIMAKALKAPEEVQVIKRPRDLSVRAWAVYLLHNAAEVEHALMIQYLYALYSLDENASGPAANDPNTIVSTSAWTPVIRGIAIEEMGHLLSVQNVLRFVGGPLSFAREDFPIDTEVYPFQFRLEPLTKAALAKYVYAEMPVGDIDEKVITKAEKAEIEERARKAAKVQVGEFVNHVGTLYATLIDVLNDSAFQTPATDGFPHDTEPFQAMPGFGWVHLQGNGSIVAPPVVKLRGPRLLSVNSIGDVQTSLSFIARQGEASDKDSMRASHFERFLDVYRQFPEDNAAGWNSPPARKVAENPTTSPQPGNAGTISHSTTQLWARLFDVRYRMLLTTLSHAVAIPRVKTPGDPAPSDATKALVRWIFQLMTEQPLSISKLAPLLTQMPLQNAPTGVMAGAPFTMPFLPIPDRDHERWQYHVDLLDSAAAVIAELKKISPDANVPAFSLAQSDLDNLLQVDQQWRNQVKTFM